MEEIVEINIKNKQDLVSKYNEQKLSDSLLKYILKETMHIKYGKNIKIVINKKCEINEDIEKIIKNGLEDEYNRSIENRNRTNEKQFIFLLLGILFIFLSTLIPSVVWKEVVLITGWVPIWKMLEIELIPDVYARRKRMIIKKILKSEIEVKDE